MSRQNKVNPGQYTQRGRLAQDDAARERSKQRSIGSQHTWQPVQKDAMPRLASKDENADDDAETSEDIERMDRTPSNDKTKPTARATRKTVTQTATPEKAAQSKTGRAAKPAAKATATRTARKAVLARNVGGGGPKPRRTTARRKS